MSKRYFMGNNEIIAESYILGGGDKDKLIMDQAKKLDKNKYILQKIVCEFMDNPEVFDKIKKILESE